MNTNSTMINLEIGRIRLRLDVESPALQTRLRLRYKDFTCRGEREAFAVQVHLQPDGGAPRQPLPPAPAPHFEREVVRFHTPGFHGTIDSAAGFGEVRLDPFLAEHQADYFLRICLALLAYQAGGLLVHAAGVLLNGRAFLFFGPSGSGKTTVARCSPPGAILNDDLVLLLPETQSWRAFGTPFSNPTQVTPRQDSAPAAALLRLVQSKEVRLAPLGRAQALAELLASVPVLNASPEPPLERCQQVLAALPAYFLHFLPDPSFWPVVAAIP